MTNNTSASNYKDFFEQLLSIVSNNEFNTQLGEIIKTHALSFTSIWNPEDFKYKGSTYTRCYIGKDHISKWEAIVMCWKRGNQTSIHGHPNFASYTFLLGEILVETFSPTEDNKVTKNAEVIYTPKSSLFAIGESSNFDNHIHRLTCLSDYAYSLHIYSDDARKGKLFTLID